MIIRMKVPMMKNSSFKQSNKYKDVLAFNQKESFLRQLKKKNNILKNIQRRRRQSCVRTFN